MMPLVLLSMLLAPEVVSAAVLRPLHAPMSRAVLWPRMPLPYMKADDDVPADAEPEAEVAATAATTKMRTTAMRAQRQRTVRSLQSR